MTDYCYVNVKSLNEREHLLHEITLCRIVCVSTLVFLTAGLGNLLENDLIHGTVCKLRHAVNHKDVAVREFENVNLRPLGSAILCTDRTVDLTVIHADTFGAAAQDLTNCVDCNRIQFMVGHRDDVDILAELRSKNCRVEQSLDSAFKVKPVERVLAGQLANQCSLSSLGCPID